MPFLFEDIVASKLWTTNRVYNDIRTAYRCDYPVDHNGYSHTSFFMILSMLSASVRSALVNTSAETVYVGNEVRRTLPLVEISTEISANPSMLST